MENPDLVRLEGEAREITALFTDIEDFTAMTERSEARKLVALLDVYLDEVCRLFWRMAGWWKKSSETRSTRSSTPPSICQNIPGTLSNARSPSWRFLKMFAYTRWHGNSASGERG